MIRRIFLKGTITTGIVVAIAGLLKPRTAFAAWPDIAFSKKSLLEAMQALGMTATNESSDIKINAPKIAENNASIAISISTSISDIEKISIFVEQNPHPLVASFNLLSNCKGFVSCRIKMDKTSDVVAVVEAQGKFFSSRKLVKVVTGGCGS